MQARIYSVELVEVEELIVIPELPRAISMKAVGKATTAGWTAPELALWMYIHPPTDGILDLDFVATAPSGIVIPVLVPICVTVSIPVPPWVIGVRVHAASNEMERKIPGAGGASIAMPSGEGLPLPWPFPWWHPHTEQSAG